MRVVRVVLSQAPAGQLRSAWICSFTGMPIELCPQGKLWHIYQLSFFNLSQFVVLVYAHTCARRNSYCAFIWV